MSEIDNKKLKVECKHCGKMISKNNIAAHRKKFHSENDKPTYADLQETIRVVQQQIAAKDHQLAMAHQELQISIEEVGRYKSENARLTALVVSGSAGVTNNTTNNSNSHNNNNINVNINNYYVTDKDGIRDGLDMTKLRTFGTENVDYVDKTKPLPTILMDIYMNDAHPENRVLSHEFLNLEWIMFRFKDHILRLHLEIDRDNFHIFYRMVCDNVEKLLGQTYDNADERYDGAKQLLRAMDNEVLQLEKKVGLKKAFDMLPIWNRGQVDGVEARMWKQYMTEPNYSQNRINAM